jgi:hypothetical protein
MQHEDHLRQDVGFVLRRQTHEAVVDTDADRTLVRARSRSRSPR